MAVSIDVTSSFPRDRWRIGELT